MTFSKSTKRIILIIAGSILLFAFVWSLVLNSNSELNRICDFLRGYGYDIYEDELIIAFDEKNTTIRKAIGEDKNIDDVIAASKSSGFNSDVNKQGDVTLLLASNDDKTVIYLYMLNGEYELCFVENENGINPLKQK